MKRVYEMGLDVLAQRRTVVGRYIPGVIHGDYLGAVSRRNRERREFHDDSDDMIGMVDIAVKQRQMNSLKTVPLSVARELLKGGQEAIDRARTLAEEYNLPGSGARDNVYWKLKWHEDALSKETGSNAKLYTSGEDLKKWVMQAFIEANAAEEGAAQQALAFGQIWSDMWNEITDAIAALPQVVKQAVTAVAQTAQSAAEGVESTVKWTSALLVGGAVVLGGGILYTLYKTITSDTGKAVATTASSAYFGRRF